MGFTEWNRKVSRSYFWEGSKTYISAFGGGKLLVVHKSDKKRLLVGKFLSQLTIFTFPPSSLETFFSSTTHISDDGCRHFFTSHSSPFLPAQFQLRGEKERDRNFPDGRRGKKGGHSKWKKTLPV